MSNVIGWEYDDTQYKLYRYYEDAGKPVYAINYKTELNTRLHPKHTVVNGELQLTEYYASATMDAQGALSYSDKVLEIAFVWNRNPLGFCYRRDASITYFLENGSAGESSKNTQKWYSNDEAISEGKRRRQNIVDSITMPVMGMMMATMSQTDEEVIQLGRDFLKKHQASFSAFINESNTKIITDVVASDELWLNNPINDQLTTIRQYILSKLAI